MKNELPELVWDVQQRRLNMTNHSIGMTPRPVFFCIKNTLFKNYSIAVIKIEF